MEPVIAFGVCRCEMLPRKLIQNQGGVCGFTCVSQASCGSRCDEKSGCHVRPALKTVPTRPAVAFRDGVLGCKVAPVGNV